jgi:hypothetical protein
MDIPGIERYLATTGVLRDRARSEARAHPSGDALRLAPAAGGGTGS